ncbi:type II toxin-antitoxin system RelE/ParE family toxin [Desulfovibrio psychrotolerans]|uniref:Plasmid stabilization protein n=1 Tax=Desulfovibrio psychrotolerans TaxID=415242 RepID=A0A7J0BRY9_9BACT|nr:type II toxin-antitoxin system RelE/ParE family toxin [Desulfovibrio psychrotolerans]GFM36449.1 plasmid stabilization protein [Desulfovibrio psychrotolerans]
MQIRFSPESVEDLKRLYEFVAEHDIDAARTIALNLKSAINRFAGFSHIGHPLEDLEGVREFVFGRYAIRYLAKGEVVYVLRVWHGKEER